MCLRFTKAKKGTKTNRIERFFKGLFHFGTALSVMATREMGTVPVRILIQFYENHPKMSTDRVVTGCIANAKINHDKRSI